MRDSRDSDGARPGGLRLAYPTLPNARRNPARGVDPSNLNVRALRVAGMRLQQWPDERDVVGIADDDGVRIVLQKSGRELSWSGSNASLLDFLEANGVEPEFSCRAGVCGTCEQGLLSGEVDYFEEPLDELPAGRVLLCCTRPKSSVVLEL